MEVNEYTRRTRRLHSLAAALVAASCGVLVRADFCPDSGSLLPTSDAGQEDAPFSVRSCDLNNDGHPDLVTANDASDTISVLLNNGDGTFAPKVPWPVAEKNEGIAEPVDVVCCDVNGDTLVDLISVNHTSDDVSVLLNLGGAQFAVPVKYTVGVAPFGVRCLDLDGANGSDLVTNGFTEDAISVLLNNGDGTFAGHVPYPAGDSPIAMTLCDVDGDSDDDVVTANMSDKNISLLRNNGDGTFTNIDSIELCRNPQTCVNPFDIVCCDLDGLNEADLAIANAVDDSVVVLLSDGSGSFGDPQFHDGVDGAFGIACCDLDGDSDEDVVTANLTSDDLGILLNDGSGTLGAPSSLPVGAGSSADPSSVECINFDGDGDFDLVTSFADGLLLFENDCTVGACGDGVVDAGESCDDGFTDACGSCNEDCTGAGAGSTCGDGVVCPETEQCDDGNDITGDGCEPTCVLTPEACTGDEECDDGNLCTTDSCDTETGVCENTPKVCTSPDPCLVSSCNLATGSCQTTEVTCPKGELCVDGECIAGCVDAGDCDDGVACTVDTCDEVTGGAICFHTPDDGACDTGLFCSQQTCDQQLGCVLDHACLSSTGNPCPDQASCDEAADNCGGCLTPAVAGVGGRYLSITPQDQGSTPLAFLVVGGCDDPQVGCVSSFVQSVCMGGFNHGEVCQSDADCPKQCEQGVNNLEPCNFESDCSEGGGTCVGACTGTALGASPSFHPASFWGEVRVGSIDIHPDSPYSAHTICNFGGPPVFSAADDGRTFRWGDATGDGAVNVIDVTSVVDVVKQVPNAAVPFEGANVWPCVLDIRVNVTDITSTVDALKGFGYPCAGSCP